MAGNEADEKLVLTPAVILAPHWAALFFVLGLVFLLIIGIPMRFLLGVSASSDRVFAVEALIAGLVADFAIRRFLARKLVLLPKLEIPLVYLWVILCAFVFLFRPFE